MNNPRYILYATITEWGLQEGIRRDDLNFDAWEYLAEKCGYKHPSALRNMCLPRRENNNAKLGLEDAIIIMNETQDYRIFHYMHDQLKEARLTKQQCNLFAEPIRSLEKHS
jgi:hypothetical protein